MNAKKSIEILLNEHRRTWGDGFQEIREATMLGIEALKRHERALHGFVEPDRYLLPGETLE